LQSTKFVRPWGKRPAGSYDPELAALARALPSDAASLIILDGYIRGSFSVRVVVTLAPWTGSSTLRRAASPRGAQLLARLS
jgi:hypothetical protein